MLHFYSQPDKLLVFSQMEKRLSEAAGEKLVELKERLLQECRQKLQILEKKQTQEDIIERFLAQRYTHIDEKECKGALMGKCGTCKK